MYPAKRRYRVQSVVVSLVDHLGRHTNRRLGAFADPRGILGWYLFRAVFFCQPGGRSIGQHYLSNSNLKTSHILAFCISPCRPYYPPCLAYVYGIRSTTFPAENSAPVYLRPRLINVPITVLLDRLRSKTRCHPPHGWMRAVEHLKQRCTCNDKEIRIRNR